MNINKILASISILIIAMTMVSTAVSEEMQDIIDGIYDEYPEISKEGYNSYGQMNERTYRQYQADMAWLKLNQTEYGHHRSPIVYMLERIEELESQLEIEKNKTEELRSEVENQKSRIDQLFDWIGRLFKW